MEYDRFVNCYYYWKVRGKPILTVVRGGIVAKIYNPYGDVAEETAFPFNGYIRAYTYPRHQALNAGDHIAYITHDK